MRRSRCTMTTPN